MSIELDGDVYAIPRVLNEGSKVHDDSRTVGRNITIQLKARLSRPGSGRLYTHFFWTDRWGQLRLGRPRPRPHRASRPGQPPAPDTGALRDSIDYSVARNPFGSEVSVGSDQDHAVYTEFGTSKMRPRPWFRVTITAMRGVIPKPWIDGIVKRERAMARRLGGRG